jgi:hypothetical protein
VAVPDRLPDLAWSSAARWLAMSIDAGSAGQGGTAFDRLRGQQDDDHPNGHPSAPRPLSGVFGVRPASRTRGRSPPPCGAGCRPCPGRVVVAPPPGPHRRWLTVKRTAVRGCPPVPPRPAAPGSTGSHPPPPDAPQGMRYARRPPPRPAPGNPSPTEQHICGAGLTARTGRRCTGRPAGQPATGGLTQEDHSCSEGHISGQQGQGSRSPC